MALSNIDYSNRLPRGARYARAGAVTSLEINENHIHAQVRGSRPRPYKIHVNLTAVSEPEKSIFLDELSTRPLIISRLFNRELAPELLSLAEEKGLKVFPKQWSDLEMNCSCPDWAVPCKHLAAVIYKTCSEIDNNPSTRCSFKKFNYSDQFVITALNMVHECIEYPTNPGFVPDLGFSISPDWG